MSNHKQPSAAPITQIQKWSAIIVIGILAVAVVVLAALLASKPPLVSSPSHNEPSSPPTTSGQTCGGSSCSATSGDNNDDVEPIIGPVTAISDTSITVDLNNRKYTFSITPDTKEFNGDGAMMPKPFNKDHSRVGEMVGVVPTKTGSNIAKLILSDFQTKQ